MPGLSQKKPHKTTIHVTNQYTQHYQRYLKKINDAKMPHSAHIFTATSRKYATRHDDSPVSSRVE